MTIWVDADACPKPVKEILFKAIMRTKKELVLVANSLLNYPQSHYIRSVKVSSGFDQADNYIVEHLNANDLVITADIHLASEVLAKKGWALNPRGEMFDKENIKARLTMRDIHDQMRSMGEHGNRFSSYGIKEKTAFANALDRYLVQN